MNRAPLSACARLIAWHMGEWCCAWIPRRDCPRQWRHAWRALHAAQIRDVCAIARRERCGDSREFTWRDAIAFLGVALLLDGGFFLVVKMVHA